MAFWTHGTAQSKAQRRERCHHRRKGEGLEERLRGQREGLKCQAKGLGLDFLRNREPLMISESVSELTNHKFLKHLAASVLEGWACGCCPCGILAASTIIAV